MCYNNSFNYMYNNNVLYNVNKVTVEAGLEKKYVKFLRKLNLFLRRRYGKYFLGLQLYESRTEGNIFYVVAAYRNVYGVYEAAAIIGKCVNKVYTEVWGTTVSRVSVFSFVDYRRVIPSCRCRYRYIC